MAPRKPSDERRKRPGNSGQADSKKRKNENFEPEMQFLLRVPVHLAEQVRMHAESTPEGLEATGKNLSIQFDEQFRQVTVGLNGTQLKGRVVDLPCIIEAHKTIDKKTVYKTNDISQLVVCEEVPAADGAAATVADTTGELALPPPSSSAQPPASAVNTSSSSKSYQWPHGITPPMRNVRKRRFRRTLLQRDVEVNGLEKELRRIIQEDNAAVSFSWKIVYDDSDGQRKTQLAGQHLAGGTTNVDDADDGAAGDNRLSTDEDSAAVVNGHGMDGDLRGDMLNDDSNLSLSSGDSEHLDDETKARLKQLAEENIRNQTLDLFGDYASSSSEDGDA